ncbi:MAG: hypothetical protein JNK85_05355 [Verrucomicrobiales bacterium]|nr:hypothetical protein [Verrucomicrobiales bacterium]
MNPPNHRAEPQDAVSDRQSRPKPAAFRASLEPPHSDGLRRPTSFRALFTLAAAIGLLAAGLGQRPAHATQSLPLTLTETVRQAESIVVGTVQSRQSRWGDASKRWMVTDFAFALEKVLYAGPLKAVAGDTITLTFWGGTLEDETQAISDLRMPALGERLMVMLRPEWNLTVSTPVVGFNEGQLLVTSDGISGAEMIRDHQGKVLALAASGDVLRQRDTVSASIDAVPATLPAFEQWLSRNVALIKSKPSELKPTADPSDPRVLRTFSLAPEVVVTRGATEVPSNRPVNRPEANAALGPVAPDGSAGAFSGSDETAIPLDRVTPQFSTSHQAHLPIVVNNFPDSFAPWSPEDEYQMSKWNYYASDVFRVFTTPTGTFGWPNGRFDLDGWPTSATLNSIYGYTWGATTIGVCFLRYDGSGWIIEADIALNPAYSFTLDDEWIYDGSSAQGFRHVMSHELGHMHGLDHNFNFLSLMNYFPSEFRAFGMPYTDDAAGIRFEYSGNAVSLTDLGIYLYYSSGFQNVSDFTMPSSVVAGSSFTVNNYHIENVGTTTIGTPTVEWYLTSARNYSSAYYFLGETTYGSLAPFTYFTPGSVSRSLTVPASVPAGNYYVAAYIRDDLGAGQSSFPFNNNFAFSRFRIAVTVPTITVSATDSAAGEPGSGLGTGTFTFFRTGATSAGLTVNFSVGGTATSGSDYSSLGSTVTFAAGSSTATKTVTVLDDSVVEAVETVTATITSGTGYNVGSPSSATVNITSDDPPVITVVATDATAGEPGSGQGSGTFTFSRTGPTTSSLTVTYTVGGTATSGSDYTSIGTSVVFAAGSSTATKTVSVINDTTVEANETVVVTLVDGASYNLGSPSVATVTIRDDDPPVITVVAADASAGEPANPGSFTFSRTGPTTAALTVNISASGTATSGSDYTSLGSTVTFAAGSATAVKTVSPIDDVLTEPTETVVASVIVGTGYVVGTPSSATVNLLDNDAIVEDLLVDNADGAAQVELVGAWTTSTGSPGYWAVNYLHDGNTGKGTKTATFIPTVLTAGSYEVFIWYTEGVNRASNLPVDVIHSGGTTTVTVNQRINGSQWVSIGTYNFPSGTTGRVRFRTTGTDGFVIADAIKLETPSALPVVTVAATDATAAEPAATGTFTFSRTGSTVAALTVNITSAGTATSGVDYSALGGTVTFAAGSATATKTVTPIDDAAVEPLETVIVNVVAGAGYTVGAPSSALVDLADNDSPSEDLLVDNADGPSQVELVGTWSTSTTAPGYFGANYLHDGNAGKGTKTATFIPTVGTAGSYEVFIWYVADANRASNLPVDIIHAAGTTTVTVNQRINGSQWVSLGTFTFNAGTAGRVRLRNAGTDGYVIADAVKLQAPALPEVTVVATDANAAEPSDAGTLTFSRTGPTTSALTANFVVSGSATSGTDFTAIGTTVTFAAGSATATKTVTPIDDATIESTETVIATVVAGAGYVVGSPSAATVSIQDNDTPPADLLVDNSDGATQVELVGAWSTSSTAPGFWGANYLHDGNAAKGTKTATFIPTVGIAGNYEVFIWYTADANRASNVPIDIIHSAGTATVTLNQRLTGSQWVSLGTYNFAVGTAGRVRIRTTGTDGYVIADAIKLQ